MKIAFMIPSYERAEALSRLLKSIHTLGDIYILQDGGDEDYSFTLDYPSVQLFRNNIRNGKEKFYQTVTTLFDLVRGIDYDYYFFIPDDLLPVPQFHRKAISLWDSIDDKRKVCLNLFLEKSRLGKPCWTKFTPRDKGNVYLTQWVDMCFMCEKKLFDVMRWQIPAVKRDYIAHPELGSGVGSRLSHRLYEFHGLNLYQVKSSLFVSTKYAFDSRMNPGQGNNLIHTEVI